MTDIEDITSERYNPDDLTGNKSPLDKVMV